MKCSCRRDWPATRAICTLGVVRPEGGCAGAAEGMLTLQKLVINKETLCDV